MAIFEMVKYHTQEYPADVPLRTEECASHFDITSVSAKLGLSLHTEYSYGKRKFDSELVQRYPRIVSAQKDSVPQLWKSEQWATEFAQFIFELAGSRVPGVIEVHPPFTDYATWDSFLMSYKSFETAILERYPDVDMLLKSSLPPLGIESCFLLRIMPLSELNPQLSMNALNSFLVSSQRLLSRVLQMRTLKRNIRV